MLHLDRILVPVDFSPPCAAALRHARAVAGRFGSAIHVLHVVDSGSPLPPVIEEYRGAEPPSDLSRAAAESALERFVAAESAADEATRVVRCGDAATEIVRYAREIDCSLIAIPTRGHGMLRQLLLGSVTAKVLHDAQCPVWTGVHPECFASTAAPEISRILCAVDFSSSSTEALRWAKQFAESFHARLSVVHVLPAVHPSWWPPLERQARKTLSKMMQAEDVSAHAHVEFGEAGEAVGVAARKAGAQLLVAGRGGATAALGRLRSSTYSLIRQSPCPVVSV